jgi:hypothetical protein
MKWIFTFSALYLTLFCLSVTKSSFSKIENKAFKVAFLNESELIIRGKTNINKFQCVYDISELSDSLKITYSEKDNTLAFTKASMALHNLSFNCGNSGINKDFNKLLKTDEHPAISIDLLSVSKTSNTSEVIAKVQIDICNIKKTYAIPIHVDKSDGIVVSGRLPIDINHFNLKAPKKVMGMIKVSNEIEIDFSLKVLKY